MISLIMLFWCFTPFAFSLGAIDEPLNNGDGLLSMSEAKMQAIGLPHASEIPDGKVCYFLYVFIRMLP